MKKSLLARICVAFLLSAALLLTPSCAKDEGSPDVGNDEVKESSDGGDVSQSEDSADETETISEKRGTEATGFDYISDCFVVVNDEKIVAEQVSKYASRSEYGAAFNDYGELGKYYVADVRVDFANMNSTAGILFGAAEATDFDGFTGYAFMIWKKYAYLYEIVGTAESGMQTNLLASKIIEEPDKGEVARLRVERDGNVYRMYYLDDMEGVEPWPEFEYLLKYADGDGVGCIDDGHGATFDSLSVTAYTPENDAGARTYKNPVLTNGQSADPCVLKYDGKYYLYATNAAVGYEVYESTDLVNWENKGSCCGELWNLDKAGYYWAPEVVEYNGRFYMIATVSEHIGFAVADSPLGPFVAEENWLYGNSIDGHVFIDDDGTAYLYYVSWRSGHEYGIYGCRLGEDLVSVVPGTEKLLLKPNDPWETASGRVTEGPYILKHNGLYYLTYSGSGYDSYKYAVGYATSDSPLGDFTRYEANPILSYTSKVYGPGHHSVTTSPDESELFIVYHAHVSTTEVHPRPLYIDRIRFAPTESGVDRLEVWGPTYTSQEYPK